MKKSRKEEVINCANFIIRKIGFSNLSFSQIAKELNITRENVHHYFKKKESLGNACLDVMIQDLDRYLSSVIKENVSAKIKLDKYLYIYINQQSLKEDCPIVSLLNEYELLPNSMKEQVKSLYYIELKYMSIILEEGLKEGVFYIEETISFKSKQIITQLKGTISYLKLEDNFEEIINYVLKDLENKTKE